MVRSKACDGFGLTPQLFDLLCVEIHRRMADSSRKFNPTAVPAQTSIPSNDVIIDDMPNSNVFSFMDLVY